MTLRLPHPVLLLLAGVGIAALLTWVVPPGEFERRTDATTGRELVVAGTYRTVTAAPVGPLGALVAVPRGMVAAGEVLISILLVGGAFALVDQLGTLRRGAAWLVTRFAHRGLWAIPMVAMPFAVFGATENMQEEIVALVPVLLVLGRGLGVDAITVVAMSAGSAAVGATFSPSNPFQAGIALQLAQLPLSQGAWLRGALLIIGWIVWVLWVVRHARKGYTRPAFLDSALAAEPAFTRTDAIILLIVVASFATYVAGVALLGWGFNELSALFFIAGIVIGMIGGLGASDATAAFLRGMETMVAPAILVGVARAISVVLTDGRIIDTIVQGLADPLVGKPPVFAALLMIPIHWVIHVAVPSVSGQAALTMPVLVPASDLIGLSRQATVFAFQGGAGLSELLIPTNGAMMAILLGAGVPWTRWIRFAFGGFVALTVVAAAGTVVAALRY